MAQAEPFTEAQLQAISAIVQQAVLPFRAKQTPNDVHAHSETNGYHYTAPEDINSAPDRVKFAYWVPNVSGGLVISKIPQKTK
jgi:N-acetyl-anhydromuramyl-L-alanine amidase AmpD